VLTLHATATAHRGQLAATAGISPGKLPTGTLRALLQACGWRLERVGRVHARGADRGAQTYRAAGVAMPEGVEPEALAAAWLAELQAPPAGALSTPIENPCRGEKCATESAGHHPPARLPLLARSVVIAWPPPRPEPALSAAIHGLPLGLASR